MFDRDTKFIILTLSVAIIAGSTAFALGWFMRGDLIYSAMFDQSVAMMKPLHDKLK